MVKSLLTMFLTSLLLVVGCASYYSTVQQTGPSGNLSQFRTIQVGWLDLGEEKYKDYGFEEKDKATWTNLLSDSNVKSMPQYLKEFISGKTIVPAKSKTDAPPSDGLFVKFTDAKYNQQTSTAAKVLFGSMGGSDTLDVVVHFVDAKANKELYTATISLKSEAGSGYGSMSFEGRVNNTVYNLAKFIAEKTNE